MLLQGAVADDNAIQIDKNEILACLHMIHPLLKGVPRIPQPESHAKEYKEAKRQSYCHLWDIFWMHQDLVIKNPPC
jgi:hypothetical protein